MKEERPESSSQNKAICLPFSYSHLSKVVSSQAIVFIEKDKCGSHSDQEVVFTEK